MHRAERWAWRVSLFCDPSESRPFDPSLPRSRLTVFDADWNILKKKRERSRQRNKLSVVAGQDWVMHDMKWRVWRQEIVATNFSLVFLSPFYFFHYRQRLERCDCNFPYDNT